VQQPGQALPQQYPRPRPALPGSRAPPAAAVRARDLHAQEGRATGRAGQQHPAAGDRHPVGQAGQAAAPGGVGSLLIPASVAAGHTGAPPGYNQILVTGASPRALAELASAHPGVAAASRQVYDAQVQADNTQNTFSNLLVLGVIASLAAVTLVNTLAIATSERRRSVRLLARTGATARQLTGMFGWNALFVTVTGTGAGALIAAGPLIVIDKLETGTAAPYIPPPRRSPSSPRSQSSPRSRSWHPYVPCPGDADDRDSPMSPPRAVRKEEFLENIEEPPPRPADCSRDGHGGGQAPRDGPVRGYGHTEISNPSTCATNYELSYLQTGALPPAGTVCQQDGTPFPAP
jgi:hypothetical protein